MNWTNFKWVNVVTLLILAVGFINLVCFIYLVIPRYLDIGIQIDTVATQIGITQLVFSVMGIGIAVLGLVGYKNIKSSAESTARKIVEEYVKKADKRFANDIEDKIRSELSKQLSERLSSDIADAQEVTSDSELGQDNSSI